MTEQEAIDLLVSAQANDDVETAHIDADNVLCTLLTELGYSKVVEAYRKVPKWFA